MAALRKYPDELRERAVKMVFDIREQDGKGHGEIRARRVPWPGMCPVNHGGLRDRAPGTAGEPDCGG
jgi:hypothetical protein